MTVSTTRGSVAGLPAGSSSPAGAWLSAREGGAERGSGRAPPPAKGASLASTAVGASAAAAARPLAEGARRARFGAGPCVRYGVVGLRLCGEAARCGASVAARGCMLGLSAFRSLFRPACDRHLVYKSTSGPYPPAPHLSDRWHSCLAAHRRGRPPGRHCRGSARAKSRAGHASRHTAETQLHVICAKVQGSVAQ